MLAHWEDLMTNTENKQKYYFHILFYIAKHKLQNKYFGTVNINTFKTTQ